MKKILAGIVLISVCGGAQAQGINPLSPSLYYEIGGGTSFNRPLTEATVSSDLTIGGQLELPLNCGIWDERHLRPSVWANSIVEYAEGQLNALGAAVVNQITNIGQGLAVAALQRALPGMYAYSQSLTASIEGRIDVSKRSCEAVVADINNGVNPLDPWRRIGTAVSWRATLREDGFEPNPSNNTGSGLPSTVIAAEAQVAQASFDPIPWFGGLRGLADEPIRVTEDILRAGYSLHANTGGGADPDLDVTAPAAIAENSIVNGVVSNGTVASRLSELFVDTGTAVEWGRRFLGEQTVFTCDASTDQRCTSQFQPGLGLSAMIEEERITLTTDWAALIASGDRFPDTATMRALSSPSVMVSPTVFEALLGFPAQDQDLYIGRLIDDVALSRTVEKALAIRKMLLSGSETPVVQGYQQASIVAEDLVGKIKKDVDDLLWNINAQKKLASNTSSALLEYDALRKSRGDGFIATGRRLNAVNKISDRPHANTEIAQ